MWKFTGFEESVSLCWPFICTIISLFKRMLFPCCQVFTAVRIQSAKELKAKWDHQECQHPQTSTCYSHSIFHLLCWAGKPVLLLNLKTLLKNTVFFHYKSHCGMWIVCVQVVSAFKSSGYLKTMSLSELPCVCLCLGCCFQETSGHQWGLEGRGREK